MLLTFDSSHDGVIEMSLQINLFLYIHVLKADIFIMLKPLALKVL